MQKISSLDALIGNDNEYNINLFDITESKNTCFENYIIDKITSEQIRNSLNSLDKRQQKIIRMRFGFTSCEKRYTFVEISNHFGISSEGVRLIHIKALQKLREHKCIKTLHC